MKILFVQYGDYAEAYHRLKSGAPETYRDQRRAVDYVAGLAPGHDVLMLVIGPKASDETLAPGLRTVMAPYEGMDSAWIAQFLAREKPDLAVVRTPHLGVLWQLRKRGVTTLPCFADILTPAGPKGRLRNLALRAVLSSRVFPCVTNHNLNASRSVARDLYYPASRIVPWDWSRVIAEPKPRPAPRDPAAPTAFYAGALSVDKGVGDCLEAVARVNAAGVRLSMSFAGSGDLDHWKAEAARLGITGQVRFLGIVPNAEVRTKMQAHDMVIVPSRHAYAEGLPNTIYEALASRSPLIVSDHPAWRGRLDAGTQCLEFTASDPASLADRMMTLCRDGALYARLSANSAAALDRIHIGIEWHALIGTFLSDPTDATGWVARHALDRIDGTGSAGGRAGGT